MHIIVLVKQIYDPEVASSVFTVDEEKRAVVPTGMQLVMSPFDEQSIEAALRIREASSEETKITVLTFGPGSANDILKHGLSLGADEGIHVSNEGLEEADSFVTASVLAKAIEKAEEPTLILAGRQAADLDSGVVACGVAELLGVPAVNWAKRIEYQGDKVTVERVLDDGVQTVEVQLPALVTVSNELGDARKASLRETMKASRKPVTEWSPSELGVEDAAGMSRHGLERLYIPKKEGKCQYIEGASPAEIVANLVHEFQKVKLIA